MCKQVIYNVDLSIYGEGEGGDFFSLSLKQYGHSVSTACQKPDPYHKQIVDNYTSSPQLWLNSSKDLGNILQSQQPVSDNMPLLKGVELWNSEGLSAVFPVMWMS